MQSFKQKKKMGKNKIKTALFGLGRIGQMHADNLRKNSEFDLKYVFDLNKNLIKLITKLLDSENKPIIIFVTHDLDEAIELADRICFLSNLPSKILLDYEVNLNRPRNQNSKEFISLKRLLSSTAILEKKR